MTALALLSLTAAVFCYAIKELHAHSKLKWSKGDDSFWGEVSYYRKYANPLDAPKDNWYYKLFSIGYKERFPLSASLLVFITDGPHFAQWAMKIFLALAFTPFVGWIWAGVIWLVWGVAFTIFYKLLSR